ncbi:MAG: type II toxin-antitoxin system Y4mF family antitoxin [Alphaproteobacteria bacterium]|nr:type II toxin-antitoxin system Y4mF family antitoxin [Alphaproteobacteria bacterium]
MESAVTAEEFGAAIRAARKAQGLRQDQLAGAAGVGVRFIVDLEGGKPTSHIGKALAVAAALGLAVTLVQPGSSR